LKGFDYAQAGEYFLTLCAYERERIFGSIVDETTELSQIGEIVKEEWLRTTLIRPNIELDEFIVMPNHVHGIIVIHDERNREKALNSPVGAYSYTPQRGKSPQGESTEPLPFRSPSRTVGAIVRGFKSASTKKINELRGTPGLPVWQRTYYEHVIRDERDLDRIREYITTNPERWRNDPEMSDAFNGMQPSKAR